MRARDPHIQTDFELERYIIEHRDPRDEIAVAAPHPGLLAMQYLFTDGHLDTCGFAADALSMDQLADLQAGALRATLAAMRSADESVADAGIQRVS